MGRIKVEKMVKIAVDGLRKDKPELKPFLIGVIKTASRMVPNLLIKFGNREFKKLKQLNSQEAA